MKTRKIISWVARVAAAVILLQTLFFKFTGAPESIYIFETLGIESFGRIGSGIIELIAGVLLLINRTKVWGALIALVTMACAILSHLLILGVDVNGDGGGLFAMALVVFFSALTILFYTKKNYHFLMPLILLALLNSKN